VKHDTWQPWSLEGAHEMDPLWQQWRAEQEAREQARHQDEWCRLVAERERLNRAADLRYAERERERGERRAREKAERERLDAERTRAARIAGKAALARAAAQAQAALAAATERARAAAEQAARAREAHEGERLAEIERAAERERERREAILELCARERAEYAAWRREEARPPERGEALHCLLESESRMQASQRRLAQGWCEGLAETRPLHFSQMEIIPAFHRGYHWRNAVEDLL
jgi:hypothetical protein